METDSLKRRVAQKEENLIIELIGDYGKWQFRITCFLLIANFFSAINALSGSFYAPNLDFWCARPAKYQNMSIDQWKKLVNNTQILQCYQYENPELKCERWEYDLSFYKNTIVDEWDLVCSRSWLISLTKASYMGGAMISVILFGQLSDIYGRFYIIWACLAMELIAGALSSYVTSIYLYIFFRFLVAVGESGKWSTGFVLLLEVTGSKYRNIIGNGIMLGWAVGYICIPFIAYYNPDYKTLQLISILPEAILFLWFFTLPESPRWLLTKHKIHEVSQIVENAARINCKPIASIDEKIEIAYNQIQSQGPDIKFSLMGLFRTPNLRRKTLLLYFSWFVNAFIYYGLSFNTNDLGGNAYKNFLIAGCVEFPAYLLVISVANRFGRRKSLLVLTFLAAITCLLCAPLAQNDNHLTLRIILAMSGKFFVTATFSLIYLYTAELFPTVARSVGVGSCSMIARLGSVIAPFVKELGDVTHLSVPIALFGILGLIDTVLLISLPETHDREMPDSLDEAENSI